MLRFLQYCLASIRILRWVELERLRNDNLKQRVEVSVADLESLEL